MDIIQRNNVWNLSENHGLNERLLSIKRVLVKKWNNLTFFSQSPINLCWQMAELSIKWFDTDFKWNNLCRDIYLDIWTYNPKTLRSVYIVKKWNKELGLCVINRRGNSFVNRHISIYTELPVSKTNVRVFCTLYVPRRCAVPVV